MLDVPNQGAGGRELLGKPQGYAAFMRVLDEKLQTTAMLE